MQTPNTGLIQNSLDGKIKSVNFVFKTLNNRIKDKIDADVSDINDFNQVIDYVDDQIRHFLSIEKQFETFGIDIVGVEKAKSGYCDYLLSKQLIQHLESIRQHEFASEIEKRSQLLENHNFFFKILKEYIAKTTKSSFQSTIESRFNSLLNGGFPIIEKSKLVDNTSNISKMQDPTVYSKTSLFGSSNGQSSKQNSSNLTTLNKPRSTSASLSNQSLDDYSRIKWIDMETLLNVYYEYDTKVLLIDFRSSFSFKENHISLFSNIINIEPISVKSDYTIQDVFNTSLLLASYKEKQNFQKLASFELIIIIDDATSILNPSSSLENLVKILFDNNRIETIKPRRRPVFLNGGYREFSRFINNQPKDFAAAQDLSSINSVVGNYIHTQPILNPPSPKNTRENFLNLQNQPVSFGQNYQLSFSQNKHPKRNHVLSEKSSITMIPTKPSKLLKSEKPNSHDKSSMIVSGLYNLGNSCYMNSVLQCLIATNDLTSYLLKEDYRKYVAKNSKVGSKGLLTERYHDLALEMLENSEKGMATTPKLLKKAVGEINEMFRNTHQQDAAEFLQFLLDTIHEDLNWSANENSLTDITAEDEANRELLPLRLASTIEWERYLKSHYSSIIDIFAGQYASRLECLNCHKTSTTYIPYHMLSVPIPQKSSQITLTDCLDKFVSPELLKGENVWKCNGCSSSILTKKKLTITRLPRVLIIHLERFTMSRKYEYVKNNCKIQIPSTLNLNEYWPKVKDASELEQLKKFPDRNQCGDWKYKLFGVVRHYGTLNSGHYISEVSKDGKWFKFDDDKVRSTESPRAETDGSAYILFYQRLN
ncbi:hypothetical protein CANINC_002733 [Pichia inconspicua]|uniref:Ubiquitin carboxyl-terminal hydrolase n=1 Tax=Pichia inconspicua TaxID=52247 RepID=A0A4V4NFN0_9ASCO|nr:hypothetical protein CANINC_002733 [[Candida] inconspicua]